MRQLLRSRFTIIISILLILLVIAINIKDTGANKADIDTTIVGTEAWFGNGWGQDYYDFPEFIPENITNDSQRVETSTVPEDLLKTMSTKGLIRTTFINPAKVNVFLFNSPQQGMNAMGFQYNGLDELYDRDDAAKYLIQFYRKMQMDYDLYDTFFTDLKLIESLLADERIINKMSSGEKQQLYTLLKNNVKDKGKMPERFGRTDEESILRIMLRIISIENTEDFKQISDISGLNNFIETGSRTASFEMSDEDYQILYSFALNYK